MSVAGTPAAHPHFDPEFDFRSDSGGRDPDAASRTLRRYHQLLWRRPLPGGSLFDLRADVAGTYLRYDAPGGPMNLSSDAALPTWTYWKRMQHIVSAVPHTQQEDFVRISYQMGGMLLFPSDRSGGLSINQARGRDRRIADRFDLTIEAIRLHYLGRISLLSETLARASRFFELFGSFDGYTEFFLLQDIIDDVGVRFFLPFTGFGATPLPRDIDEYRHYRSNAIAFVRARNERMRKDVAGRMAARP